MTYKVPADAQGLARLQHRRPPDRDAQRRRRRRSDVHRGRVQPDLLRRRRRAAVVARRTVIDLAKCLNVPRPARAPRRAAPERRWSASMCHNPNGTDVSRPADRCAPAESIDFKRMIHRIHTGEELTQDYTVYGFGGPTQQLQRGHATPATAATAWRATRRQPTATSRSDGALERRHAARLLHAAGPRHGGVPRLPRHARRRGARLAQHGALRRGLRRVPRRQLRVVRRDRPRPLITEDARLPASIGGRASRLARPARRPGED